jgi:hypothetical protein
MLLDIYLHYIQESGPLFEFQICFFRDKNPLKRIRYLDLLDKFNLDKSKALIVGSAVLVLHGVIDENNDLDLVLTREEFNKLQKFEAEGLIKDYKYKKVFYVTKDKKLEAAVNFQLLQKTTEELLRRALDVEGYKFMSLRDTFKMYKVLNREKDVEKIDKLTKIFH